MMLEELLIQRADDSDHNYIDLFKGNQLNRAINKEYWPKLRIGCLGFLKVVINEQLDIYFLSMPLMTPDNSGRVSAES